MPEKFSASRAGKHMACHGSANLDLLIPGWEPPVEDPAIPGAAGMGTQIHEFIASLFALLHVTASKTTKFNAKDMLALSQILLYVGELWSTRRFKVLVEAQAQASWLMTLPSTTVDLVFHTQDEMHIIDYKWGKIPVDAVGNKQLLFYLACFYHLSPKAKEFHLHILQPHADNMEAWVVSRADLMDFIKEAQATEQDIQAGSIKTQVTEYCTFCPAFPHGRGLKGKPFCPTATSSLYPPVFDTDDMLEGEDLS